MPYTDIEISAQLGSPHELYKFELLPRGQDLPVSVFRYTSAQAHITLGADTYEPVAMRREQYEQSEEIGRTRLKIRLPLTASIMEIYSAAAPDGLMRLTITRVHSPLPAQTTLQTSDAAIIWIGRVSAATFDGALGVLDCEPIAAALARKGLRGHYQLTCRHDLYGAIDSEGGGCGVDRNLHAFASTVVQSSGSLLLLAAAPSQPNGHFTLGYVLGPAGQRRMVREHVGALMTLNAPLSLQAGNPVIVFAGCDKTLPICRDKFANLVNFGGFPWIPHIDPFGPNNVQ